MKTQRAPLFLVVTLFLGLALLSWYGLRGYHAWKRRQLPPPSWKHQFTEPPKGKLPPSFPLYGLIVGESGWQDVQRFTAQQKLVCLDNSVSAMMQRKRKLDAEKNKKAGKADAVSGATWKKRPPRAQNPSIRWNCERVQAAQISSFTRPHPAHGRLLFVLDSPKHPLRHISYQYDLLPAKAVDSFQAAVNYFTQLLGKPDIARDAHPLPQPRGALKPLHSNAQPVKDNATSLPASKSHLGEAPIDPQKVKKYGLFLREWRYAGLVVRLSMRSFGRWFNLSESVEIPWPIRPDAPKRLRQTSPR